MPGMDNRRASVSFDSLSVLRFAWEELFRPMTMRHKAPPVATKAPVSTTFPPSYSVQNILAVLAAVRKMEEGPRWHYAERNSRNLLPAFGASAPKQKDWPQMGLDVIRQSFSFAFQLNRYAKACRAQAPVAIEERLEEAAQKGQYKTYFECLTSLVAGADEPVAQEALEKARGRHKEALLAYLENPDSFEDGLAATLLKDSSFERLTYAAILSRTGGLSQDEDKRLGRVAVSSVDAVLRSNDLFFGGFSFPTVAGENMRRGMLGRLVSVLPALADVNKRLPPDCAAERETAACWKRCFEEVMSGADFNIMRDVGGLDLLTKARAAHDTLRESLGGLSLKEQKGRAMLAVVTGADYDLWEAGGGIKLEGWPYARYGKSLARLRRSLRAVRPEKICASLEKDGVRKRVDRIFTKMRMVEEDCFVDGLVPPSMRGRLEQKAKAVVARGLTVLSAVDPALADRYLVCLVTRMAGQSEKGRKLGAWARAKLNEKATGIRPNGQHGTPAVFLPPTKA